MFRLLVVVDDGDYYQDYLLRIFEKLLPMEEISITHISTIAGALGALQEAWEMILMDYSLGPKADFLGDVVRDGKDLIAFRRAIERREGTGTATIVGISSNRVGNDLLREQGANCFFSKLSVELIALCIKKEMARHE